MGQNLVYFQEDESSSVFKPFVEKFVEQNPSEIGEVYEIVSVERARSGSGYKLETEKFVVFLRSNSKLLGYLLEALQVWCKTPGSPSLVVELTGERPHYKMAANTVARRSWSESSGKYIVVENSTGGSQRGGNPFLQPSTPPPVPHAQEDYPYPGQEMEPPKERKRRAS